MEVDAESISCSAYCKAQKSRCMGNDFRDEKKAANCLSLAERRSTGRLPCVAVPECFAGLVGGTTMDK